MQYSDEQRDQVRRRMVAGIGRGFRQHGYGGIGVDGLAKAAGVTSGAFYNHFQSKSRAFEQALVAGLDELALGISGFQAEHGAAWLGPFIDFYLGSKRHCDLSEACALQALGAEVMRSSADARSLFQTHMLGVVEQVASGMAQATPAARRARAWALMSLLSGAVTAARAVHDAAVANQIAAGAKHAALLLAAA